MRPAHRLAGLALLLGAAPLAAQALRPLCASRPGLGTPPCILDKGHVQAEVGLVTVMTDSANGIDAQTVAWGSTEISYGIDGINQLSVVWSPVNIVTLTDRTSGDRRTITGVGDVALRWRHSLRNPDGEGVSIAVEALVNTLTGGREITDNAWSFGLLVPVSVPITDSLSFIAAPGFIWSENRQGSGQHFNYNGSFGLTKAFGHVSINLEAGYTRDGDPGSGRSSATVASSLAWSPGRSPDWQFDIGGSVAANPDAPDLQFYLGAVKRF